MAWFENVPRVEYEFIDAGSSTANVDLHFPLESDLDLLWAAVQQEDRIFPLSDCVFRARRLVVGATQTGMPDPTGSNLAAGYIVFRSDAQTYTSILIPGIRSDLLITNTAFKDLQIDMAHPDVAMLLAAMLTIPTVTQRGDPVVEAISGGAIQMWAESRQRSG